MFIVGVFLKKGVFFIGEIFFKKGMLFFKVGILFFKMGILFFKVGMLFFKVGMLILLKLLLNIMDCFSFVLKGFIWRLFRLFLN